MIKERFSSLIQICKYILVKNTQRTFQLINLISYHTYIIL